MEAAHITDWDGLLEQARQGDKAAQNRLLSQLEVTLRPILQYRLQGWPRPDLDDVLQETLITFSQKLDRVKSNPHYYALAILRNKVGDALRNRREHRALSLEVSPGSVSAVKSEVEQILIAQNAGRDVHRQVEEQELLAAIENALKKLSVFCQTFFLGVLEHRDMEDMWQMFRSSQPDLLRGTFRKRIFDCRMKLQALLQERT